MITFEEFQDNLNQVRKRMQAACSACGRNVEDVKLLPVTKNHPVDAVNYALRSGMITVGENRVQEALDKMSKASNEIKWELIGHLQSNKSKIAVDHFDRVQTVDSIKLADRLNLLSKEKDKVLSVLIQVNTGEDPSKFGIKCEEAKGFFEKIMNYDHLAIDGLMTIAPLDEDKSVASKAFSKLRELQNYLEKEFKIELKDLSMGMTEDMEEAIREGSTMIRVSTALFGVRE